jgi:hypothetical protein
MFGLIGIFIFVVLLAFPGFYIITRKVFPKSSKRSSVWISAGLTLLLVAGLLWGILGVL